MYKKLIFAVLFSFCFSYSKDFTEYAAYLDLEDNEPPVQAFTKPGLHWSTCELVKNEDGSERCKDSVGFLHKNAKIIVLEEDIKKKYQDRSGQSFDEEYAKVAFEYTNRIGEKIENVGYIPMGRLKKLVEGKKLKTIYSEAPKTKKQEDCDQENAVVSSKDQNKINKIGEGLSGSYFDRLVSMTSEAKKIVGQCVQSEAKSSQPYDELLLRKIPSKSSSFNRSELIQIDSLARTIYAEMQGCYKYGLHYPMAVARIILNRAEAAERSKGRAEQFIKGTHSEEKPNAAKVATSSSQFKVWEAGNNTHHALCPPSSKDVFWKKGAKPSSEDLAIWENSLRIAIEATKFPTVFKQRTGGDNFNILFYTSGKSSFYDFVRVDRLIQERDFKKECLQFWVEPKKSKKKS